MSIRLENLDVDGQDYEYPEDYLRFLRDRASIISKPCQEAGCSVGNVMGAICVKKGDYLAIKCRYQAEKELGII